MNKCIEHSTQGCVMSHGEYKIEYMLYFGSSSSQCNGADKHFINSYKYLRNDKYWGGTDLLNCDIWKGFVEDIVVQLGFH